MLQDLSDRFDAVLEAIEATAGWVTNRVAPGKIILDELGDIESGVRQLIRNRPLEVAEVSLPPGQTLRVPTPDETLRIKGYLIVRHNQVRDYLDVAALSATYGIAHAAAVLRDIDVYELVFRILVRQKSSIAGTMTHDDDRHLADPGRGLGRGLVTAWASHGRGGWFC